MGEEVLSRCGNRCDLCLAYKANIEKNDQRHTLSHGWYRFFGLKINPEDMYCEGCIEDRSCIKNKLAGCNCEVRPCVIKKSIENCSQCDEFPCEKISNTFVSYDDIKKKYGGKITRIERKTFILPYENKDRLMDLKKKYGVNSPMLNKLIKPDEKAISKFLEEKEVVNAWKNIQRFIMGNYQVKERLIFYGDEYGWALQYKNDNETLLTMFPRRKKLEIMITLGRKELKRLDLYEENISENTIQLIEETHRFSDGKWVWIDVKNKESAKDVVHLIKIKETPLRETS